MSAACTYALILEVRAVDLIARDSFGADHTMARSIREHGVLEELWKQTEFLYV